MDIPEEFLAKILKTLVKSKLVKSVRGSHGGYSLAVPASQVTFLSVIEAVEGPISINLCTEKDHGGCNFTKTCTMFSIWSLGQERMLEVYRNTRLDKLAMRSLTHRSPLVRLGPVPEVR